MKPRRRNLVFLCFVLFTAGQCLAQQRDRATTPLLQGPEEARRSPSGSVKNEYTMEARTAALRGLKGGPLRFEKNAGQFDSKVKFASRGVAHSLFLTPDEAVLVVTHQEGEKKDLQWSVGRRSAAKFQNLRQDVARLKLMGSNPSPQIDGLDELPGRSNYLRGRNKNAWHTNVPNFTRVRYREVYRGIDWVHYGNEGRLEYDFVVSAGADPAQISMVVSTDGRVREGAVRIDANGDLLVAEDPQAIRFHRPVAFQMIEGQKRLVSANYVMKSPGRFAFELGPYDRSQTLVIDPVLAFSTYLGGSLANSAWGVAVDASGVYVAGQTNSGDFPIEPLPGAVQDTPGTGSFNCSSPISSPNPCFDAYVSKLSADGSTLIYSTFLGGSALDGAFGLAVDGNGQAVVAGGTYSTDFPTTDNPLTAFQNQINGGAPAACQNSEGSTIDCEDAFVAVLNSTGTSLVYSTYVGGTGTDYASGAAVDASGNAYLTGFTDSDAASFPETAGAPGLGTCTDGTSNFVCGDAFAGKFQYSPVAANPTASRVFLSYIGGNGDEFGNGIAVENSTGNVFVAGETSPNSSGGNSFSVVNGFQSTFGGGSVDAFVTKLNGTGSIPPLYSSFLGGSANDRALDIGLDSTGKAFVGGYTSSSDFPVKSAYQPARDPSNCNGCLDSFITKVDTTLAGASSQLFSTYFGGSGDDAAFGLAVDTSGNVFIAGATSTPETGVTKTFPLMNPIQATKAGAAGEYDGFVSELNSTGSTLLFSTYLGGTGDFDVPLRITAASSGVVAVAGLTNSYDFPATLGSYQPFHFGAGDDAFIVKIDTAANLPAAAFSDDILFFGSLGLGFTSMKTVTLQNVGSAVLNISDVSLGGTDPASYQFVSHCGTSVVAGSKCTIDVTFAPTTTGVKNAMVVITDNASGSPHQVGLNGRGSDFSVTTPGSSKTVSAGATASYTLTITPTDGFDEQITFTCSGAPVRSTCQPPSAITPDGSNTPVDVTLNVVTQSRSAVPPGVGPFRTPPLKVPQGYLPGLLALLLLTATSLWLAAGRRRAPLLLMAALCTVLLWTACGGGGGGGTTPPPTGTPAGTYTITATATSGSLSKPISLTLVVQ